MCTEPFYDNRDCWKDTQEWGERGSCCTPDYQDLPEGACRCCNFKRSDASKTDLGFGYYSDQEENDNDDGSRRSQQKHKKHMNQLHIERVTKWLLGIQCVVFVCVGIYLMTQPESAAHLLLYSNQYYVRTQVDEASAQLRALGGDPERLLLGEGGGGVSQLDTPSTESSSKKSSALSNSVIGATATFLTRPSLFSGALHTLQKALDAVVPEDEGVVAKRHAEEKRANLVRQAEEDLRFAALQEAKRIAAEQPHELTVTSFTGMFGAMCFAFGAMSFMARNCTDITKTQVHASTSICVYASLIISLILSSTRRSGGNESTTFMLASLVFSFVFLCTWGVHASTLQTFELRLQHQAEKKLRKRSEKRQQRANEQNYNDTFFSGAAHAELSRQVENANIDPPIPTQHT